MPQAAITGATGFIGTVITRHLLAAGYTVRALARSAAGQAQVRELGAQAVPGALDDTAALGQLLDGADAVVHCAGVVRGADYADFASVNVDGTARLLGALAGRQLPLVALSSLAAREAELSHYAASKRAMEALLDKAGGAQQWLALRPPAVYGPGDRELRPLFDAMARGVALLPAPADARVSLIYVDDLAAAVVAWLGAEQRTSGVFELHDGKPRGYSWDEVVTTAERLLGRRVRRLRLPGAPLRAVGRANQGLSRLLGYAPMLTPGKLRELQHPDWACDNTALQQTLDWQPQVQLAEGLRRTCGWGH